MMAIHDTDGKACWKGLGCCCQGGSHVPVLQLPAQRAVRARAFAIPVLPQAAPPPLELPTAFAAVTRNAMLCASVSPCTQSSAKCGYSCCPPFHLPGHVFNMPHDNVKACEEVFGRLKTNHMMSPTLIQIDRANPWSACSAAIITDFLDSGHGELSLSPCCPCPHAVLIPVMVMETGCWGRQQISPCSPNKSRRKQRAEWCFIASRVPQCQNCPQCRSTHLHQEDGITRVLCILLLEFLSTTAG